MSITFASSYRIILLTVKQQIKSIEEAIGVVLLKPTIEIP